MNDMNLEKLINLALSDSNLTIEYSNVNGVEKLIVNGEDVSKINPSKTFDDTKTVSRVKNHLQTLEMVDDCMFNEALDIIKQSYDLLTINNLLDQEHFTEDEAEAINEFIDFSESVYKILISEKVEYLKELYKRF